MKLVDFKIIREDWTVVELQDKAIIRMRPVLLFLRRDISRPRKVGVRGGMRLNLQFGVWARRKGSPTKEPITTQLIQKNIAAPNLTFRFLSRGDSLYRTDDEDLKVAATPTRFDRSSLFDKDGEPVYFVQHELTAVLSKEMGEARKNALRRKT